MSHRCAAISLLILKHGEHTVAGQIIWVKSEKMLHERNAGSLPQVIFNLRCPLQRRNIVSEII